MNSMKIMFAFSPKVKAILDDGTEKELIIMGNKGGHLLVKDISENAVYELACPYAGYHNEIKYDVVAINGQPPSPPAPTPTTYTVTVTDSATNVASVSPESKEVEEGESATFTLTYASGKTASDVKASSGSISGTTLTVSSVSEDVTVTLTDLLTVSVTNSATAVSAVTPEFKKLEAGSNAVFALTFAAGKSASDIEVSAGSVAGTTLTVSNVSEDTTVTITDKPSYTIGVTNSSTAVSAVSPESSSVLKGGNATFTLTFAEGKSAADIEVSAGTVEGTTLTVSNVQANATVTISDKE